VNPKIEFFRHGLGEDEREAVLQAMGGTILTTGAWVERAEEALAEYLGVQAVVGLDSCTGALHLALLALGVGGGDEVITTPLSFIATANAIEMAGAQPVFVDVDPASGNLDPDRVEAAVTARTAAILPVHLYGQLCDMVRLREVAARHGLAVVEDAAHCLEGHRGGVRPAALSDCACFSFYATKSITCGEGGALATNDLTLASRVRRLALHGMTEPAVTRHRQGFRHWDMVELGWKYNLDNIRASMLVPQLRKVASWRERRAEIARRYRRALSQADLELPICRDGDGTEHAHHMFTIWVGRARRDGIIAGLQERGVPVTVNYRPIHLTSYYAQRYGYRPGCFPIAEEIGERTITLPLYSGMCDADVEQVIRAVLAVCRRA